MINYIELFPADEKVFAVFSTKQAGDLQYNQANQENFFKQFGIDFDNVVKMEQVHKADVEFVDGKKQFIPKVDALFTNKKGIFLGVNTADCLPIYVYSSNPEFAGIIHGGWRCLLSGIIDNFFKIVEKEIQIDYSQVKVVIGPNIQKCCFEIKEDVLEQFDKYKNFISKKDKKILVDLPQIAKYNLTKMGVFEYNIELIQECTCCSADKYFSYRREKQDMAGEMMGIIGLR